MCSVAEGSDDLPIKKIESSELSRMCMKCSESAVVIIRINDAFCRACFQTYCTHKFRSAFGKSKLIRDGERVLVAHSGGHCSTAILHLIQEGLSKRAQKKLRFQPCLVYINEGAVYNQSADEQANTIQTITQPLKASNMPYHVVDLHKVFEKNMEKLNEGQNDLEPGGPPDPNDMTNQLPVNKMAIDDRHSQQLQDLLKSCQTLTAKEDILRRLRYQLLVNIAVAHGYSKIILGDSATRLSVRLLSDIAQGRGMHIPDDVGFSDTRYAEAMFVRPLREFTIKEVAMYNHLNQLCPIVLENLSTKVSAKASIDSATEAFVTGLQAQFPSTVSTICRTGEKLEGECDISVQRCVLCKAALDTSVPQSSALFATEFSQVVSKPKTHSNEVLGTVSGSDSEDFSRISRSQLKETLCYGCRLVLRDMESVDDLPEQILHEASRKMHRSQMKKSIDQFLLDDQPA